MIVMAAVAMSLGAEAFRPPRQNAMSSGAEAFRSPRQNKINRDAKQHHRMKNVEKDTEEKEAESADFMSILGGVAEEMTTAAAMDYIIGTVDYNSWRDSYSNVVTHPGASGKKMSPGSVHVIKGFLRPVPGLVTSNFGFRPKYGRMHHGIDLSLSEGDTVRAAMTGVVEKVAYDFGGFGHYVLLRHAQGIETLYGHLHHPTVRKGDIVGIGMPIGIGGNTGRSTGPHLHLEVRMNGIAVDPRLVYNF